MSEIRGAVESIDKLIELKEQQIGLLRELRRALDIAHRAGVDPKEIERMGYDPSVDKRWLKWPAYWTQEMKPETNYVILKDGRRVDFEIDWETRLKEDREKRRELANKRGY